ncbi:hypothetical protein AX16_000344 [Volvariella volvacea WC 439]|nr:hypothetical protein AX16_000344 [Volvariella volvacea WC 439]
MLIRRFVNASLRLLIRAEWRHGAISEYNQILSGKGGPLCPSDTRVPAGLTYHLADIYLDEINKSLSVSTELPAPLCPLLRPFFTLAAQTQVNVTYQRIQSAVLEPLFSALSPPVARDDDPPRPKRIRLDSGQETAYPNLAAKSCFEDPKSEGCMDALVLRKKLMRALFEVASQPETRESNRRKLYALWREEAVDAESDSD